MLLHCRVLVNGSANNAGNPGAASAFAAALAPKGDPVHKVHKLAAKEQARRAAIGQKVGRDGQSDQGAKAEGDPVGHDQGRRLHIERQAYATKGGAEKPGRARIFTAFAESCVLR
jgi:hypothetical protein